MWLRSLFRFIGLILTLGLVGCGGAPASTPIPTGTMTPTLVSPTLAATPTRLVTLPPTPTNTSTPAPSPTSPKVTPTRAAVVPVGSMRIKIFMIALNDAGKLGKKIGCNDSVVAVERIIPATNAVLRASLNELLAVREREYGSSGLYNALAQSTLKLDNVTFGAGKATVYLSGNVILEGTCDRPRVEAQLKETALQFSSVRQVSIFINKIPLDQVLSGKGN